MFSPHARWDRSMPEGGLENSRPVDVWVRFSKGRVMPVYFILEEYRFIINRINYTWKAKTGRVLMYFFSVSDKSDTYRLCFNTETMAWRILSDE